MMNKGISDLSYSEDEFVRAKRPYQFSRSESGVKISQGFRIFQELWQ